MQTNTSDRPGTRFARNETVRCEQLLRELLARPKGLAARLRTTRLQHRINLPPTEKKKLTVSLPN